MYPIIAVYLPCETGYWNHLESNISLQPSQTKLIQLVFPIKLEKGDTFDIVSYSNKKETKNPSTAECVAPGKRSYGWFISLNFIAYLKIFAK